MKWQLFYEEVGLFAIVVVAEHAHQVFIRAAAGGGVAHTLPYGLFHVVREVAFAYKTVQDGGKFVFPFPAMRRDPVGMFIKGGEVGDFMQ